MIAILVALAPVYLEDYQLRRYLGSLVHSPNAAATPDEMLRSQVLTEARKLVRPPISAAPCWPPVLTRAHATACAMSKYLRTTLSSTSPMAISYSENR